MSRYERKHEFVNKDIEYKRAMRKQAGLFRMQKRVSILALVVLFAIGIVSTTFASLNLDNAENQGSLKVAVQNAITSKSDKNDLTDTGANVDIAETGGNRTFAANEYFYLKNYKPSGWGDCWITSSGKAYLYVWGSGYSGEWYPFELISGTAGSEGAIYGAKITTAGTCSNFILTRGASNYAGGWSGSTGFWNQTANQSYDESNLYNGFYGLGTSGTSWTGFYYAQKPASVTATVTDAISGSGTSSDPYLVYAGDSYTVQLSATKTDPGNEGFGWNINSSSSKASSGTSSTYTKSYTAGSADTTTTYTGYAWCYEKSTDNYSSSYIASNQIYVKSIANGYSYTVTAGEGGTVSPTSGTATSVQITATPNTGYSFAGWTCTNGSVENASSATTTFTPSANGANAKATFTNNLTPGSVLYLKPNANWLVDGARFACYFYNSSSDTWVDMTKCSGTDYYEVTVPEGGPWTNLIFVRMNPATTDNNWTNKWDQTKDLTYDGTNNLYTVAEGAWDKGNGTWSTLTLYEANVTPGEGGTVSATVSDTAVSEFPIYVVAGNSITITATPNAGYAFDKWICTNGSVANASSATTTFTPSANGATATATFKKLSYTVTASASPSAGGTATVTSTPVTAGGSTNISATANTGYRFTGWTITSGTGTFGNASSVSTTYSPTSDSDLSANFSKIDYNITVNESGGTGTVIVANTAQYGDSVSLSVTPPENYKILSITGAGLSVGECESYTGSFTMPANNVSITITYALDGVCTPVFAYGDQSLVLGGTFTNTATTNEFCEGNKTFTYSSSDTSVASVNASTGLVTAKKHGTATITATCDCGATATYKVTVKTPAVSVSNMTLNVNGTATASPTITDGPASGYTITYSTASTNITVSSAGLVTAKKPGTATVSFAMTYGGETVATGSFSVTVKTPTVSITPNSVNLLVGQTMTDAFATTTSVTAQSVTLATNAAGVATVSENKATARGAGTATITASFKYNDSYTATATATVNVVVPTISADKTSVTLEYGGGTTTQDVTITTNASSGNGTGDDITVSSASASIATATVSGNKVTIEAKGIGSTTVTAKFHDATVEIPVTVKAYDPYVYLYVTDAQGWGDMYIHAWIENGDNDIVVVELTGSNSHMTYIGRNGDNQKIFAYKFEKTNLPTSAIFVKSGSWPSTKTDRTGDNSLSFGTNNYQALYIASATDNSGYRTIGDWTSSCSIVRPTVSVADVVVPVADTATATATVTDGDKVLWTVENTSVATVNDVDTQTATVTGVTPGETKITARAFVDTANSSIKSLPTNYKTDKTSWEFISTEATATVTVEDVYYELDVYASYSDNGTSYTKGTIGGTVSGTLNSTALTFPATVSYKSVASITASNKSGYRFVGWFKDGSDTVLSTEATINTSAITADTVYEARFIKTYSVTVNRPNGFDSTTCNGRTYTSDIELTYDVGTSVTVSATVSDNYRFDHWDITTSGGTTTSTDIEYTFVVSENVILTPVAVRTYLASSSVYTNKVLDSSGGTVTVSTDRAAEGETVTYVATANANYYFAGWYSDTNFATPVSTNVTYEKTMTTSGVNLYALFVKRYYISGALVGEDVELTYDIATDTYSGTSSYNGNAFTVVNSTGVNQTASVVNVIGGTHIGATVSGTYNGYTLNVNTEEYDTTKPITYKMTSNGNATYKLNISLVEKPKYSVTVVEQGGTGTVKLNGTIGTSLTDIHSGKTVTVSITPPKNYVIESITGGVTSGKTDSYSGSFTITGDTTITVKYAKATQPKVTVNIAEDSEIKTGGSVEINGTESTFGAATEIDYMVDTTITVTPPQGYYAALASEDNIVASSFDEENGTFTFTVNLSVDASYDVKFVQPKIYLEQPQYGSIYITSGSGNNLTYYFYGDSVPFGTNLTINVKPDHTNAFISNVYVNNSHIGNEDGLTFKIIEDSTVTADIVLGNSHEAFTSVTAYGTRRVFFKDNLGWGEGNIAYHTSTKANDTSFASSPLLMNKISENYYYADITFGHQYITFYKANDPNTRFVSTVSNYYNAFEIDSNTNAITNWRMAYSDYRNVEVDEANKKRQQAVTTLNNPVVFDYSCNFGDDTLSAEVIAGNSATCAFRNGSLTITPTDTVLAGYSLIKVSSASSTTVKYYLIKVERLRGSLENFQKIYNIVDSISLTAIFEDYSSPLNLTYHISSDNVFFSNLTDKEIVLTNENRYSFDISTIGVNGVKYIKIEAVDNKGRKTVVSEKTVFGAESKIGYRYIYLNNTTSANISKYNVRACFESDKYDEFWVTMQPVGESGTYYRAMIPDDYNYRVSFYLTDKNSYCNKKYTSLVNSGNSDNMTLANTHFCYYRENIILTSDISNPTYNISALFASKTMGIELLQ